jgi:hypothetical protein
MANLDFFRFVFVFSTKKVKSIRYNNGEKKKLKKNFFHTVFIFYFILKVIKK